MPAKAPPAAGGTPFTIATADTPDAVTQVAQLFRAYAASLDTDLCFQGFDAELAGLPGLYAPPAGALLLARDASGAAVGCVAVRPLDSPGCCEMKRLYVAPAARGRTLGRMLMAAALAAARDRLYREMRLDTLPSMVAAQAMYRAAGFVPIAPYSATPVAGTIFLACTLTPLPANAGPAAR